MKKIALLLLFLTLGLLGDIAHFEAFVKKKIADKTPPSASFAILKGDRVVYTKSMGYNDANRTQRTTTKSVYHVYSLTKILTATLVMQLIEEKKIGLYDSVKNYFPNFDAKYKGKSVEISILSLLNHSSGIKDGSFEIYKMMQKEKSDLFIELPYLPGTESKYSNAEYILLSKIVEKATGKNFVDLIKEYIIEPSKMSRSDFIYNSSIADEQVYGTIRFFSIIGTVMKFMLAEESKDFYEGSMLWLKEFDIEWQAAGGMVSSIDDMAKFLSYYQANRLFSLKTKSLFVNQKAIPVHSWLSLQDEVNFGIGWYHIRDKGKFFYQHQGVGPGFRTIMRIYPELDLSFIILTSQTGIDIDAWADRLISDIEDHKTLPFSNAEEDILSFF